MALSVISISVFGLNPGIDFTGGTIWQVKSLSDQLTTDSFKNFLENEAGIKNPIVYPELESKSVFARFGNISEENHQKYLEALKLKFSDIDELRFDSIGPVIGKELKRKAVWAVILVLLGISFYVAFAFRKVSYPVKSFKYGAIALITLFHDVFVPIGLLSFLGWKYGVEVDINFIVALLVIAGFSVHDTIVVFDRIRENLILRKDKDDFVKIVNDSVNQTIARSVNTSLTLFLVLLALFFFGPISLKYFVLTILAGTAIGTYSSIFVASPLLTVWYKIGKI